MRAASRGDSNALKHLPQDEQIESPCSYAPLLTVWLGRPSFGPGESWHPECDRARSAGRPTDLSAWMHRTIVIVPFELPEGRRFAHPEQRLPFGLR